MLFGKHFRKYYLKYAIPFLIGIAVLVVINWFQLYIPEYMGDIINELKKETPDIPLINQYLIWSAFIAFGIMVGRFVWRFTIFGAARRIEHDLRTTMFKHATKLPQQYYSQEKVGGMMTYFINDLESIRQTFGMGILMLVDGLVLGSFVIYRMWNLDHTLTLLAAVPMLLMMIVAAILMRRGQKRFKERQKSFENLSDFTQENFSGITVIKAFVREAKEMMLFRWKNDEFYKKHMGFVRYMVFFNIILSIAINLVILLIIVYGSFLVIYTAESGWETGELTKYIAYFFTLIWPTMALGQFMGIQSQAKASAERINSYLNEEIVVRDQDDVLENVKQLEGIIEAKNLSFSYPDSEQKVLDQVSFKINKGEMVGILGRTGSGKSSLVDLLLRTYNLEEEKLFIDGYDVMKLPIQKVRDLMGYVPQDNFLFSDTIASNIGFSHQIPDLDIVVESAKLSDVYDNVMDFPDQFETILGERGVTVSGGQKQRLSIARALAKDPQILILDDSVSAVDTKTEEAIISNLHRVRKGKTTIFIAHRISTVKKMDKIILLEQGKIVAIGNHKELMKKSSLYQDMVKRQTLENIVEGGNAS